MRYGKYQGITCFRVGWGEVPTARLLSDILGKRNHILWAALQLEAHLYMWILGVTKRSLIKCVPLAELPTPFNQFVLWIKWVNTYKCENSHYLTSLHRAGTAIKAMIFIFW